MIRTGFVLLLALSVLSGALPARAADKDAQAKIEKEKKELDRLKSEIERQKKKRSEAAKTESSILDQMEDIDHERALKKKELSVVNLQLAQRDREIRELEQELQVLRQEVREKEELVRDRVRALYQDGRFGSLKVLVGSRDYYEFIKRYYYLSWVSEKQGRLLGGFREAVASLLPKEAELKKARAELAEYKTTINRNLARIKKEKKKKETLLARVKTEKATRERTIEELEVSRAKIQDLIQELEKGRLSRAPSASLGFSRQRGFLDWPTKGRILSKFGRQKHPDFDTTINRKGIEIQASEGRPIRSVFDGTVVYADWFKGYGLLVILDHGGNYYSLYAHAAELLVVPGDKVTRRQVIGKIGDTGLTKKANLYFEIRNGSKAENPLKWLKKP
ncbi:MAG TPA: peptidoglycan DD-metalloendopeptidase family protein [Nitrospiria bacterium]